MKKGSLVVELILIIIGVALTLLAAFTPVQSNNMPQNQPAMQGEMQTPPQDAEGQQNMQAPPQGGQNQPGAPGPEGMGMPQSEQNGTHRLKLQAAASLIIYLLIIHYAFEGYKVPHGNLLRYLMFAFAISVIAKISGAQSKSLIYTIALTSALITYISGRLNKIQKNKVLMLAVTILIVLYIVIETTPLFTTGSAAEIWKASGPLGLLVQWLVIMNTYIGRFKEHAEAGLEDKVKE